MVAIIVLSVVVWLSIPFVLSRAMARRGFHGLSYLIVGVLFGPVAVVFAVMDALLDGPSSVARVRSSLPPRDVGDAWRALLLGAPPVLL